MWDRLIYKEILSPRANPTSSTEIWFSSQLDIYPVILFLNPFLLRQSHKSAFSFYIILFLHHGYGNNPPSPSWSFFLPSFPPSFIIIIINYYMLTNKVMGSIKGFFTCMHHYMGISHNAPQSHSLPIPPRFSSPPLCSLSQRKKYTKSNSYCPCIHRSMVKLSVASPLKITESSTPSRSHQQWKPTIQHPCCSFKDRLQRLPV